MPQRIAISKKVRFEVFKRDKFICQYCGGKSPEVILNVDHIDPVAKGGNNDIINLITSCFDCNSGKSDRKLDDSSVVEKQRKQLELIQERREQIELLLEWKKSLSNLETDTISMVVEYFDSKIKPFTLNENGNRKIEELLKQFKTAEILDGIDETINKYIKYEDGGGISQKSIEDVLTKLGGVMAVKKMPPVKQKLAYIKGIARNRFSYWDDKKGSIILANYVSALEKHYSEQQLLDDIEKDLVRISKEASTWSEWRDVIEKWTDDISKWELPKPKEPQNISDAVYSYHELSNFASYTEFEQQDKIGAIIHIASIFPNFGEKLFIEYLNEQLLDFLQNKNVFQENPVNREDAKNAINKYLKINKISELFAHEVDDNWGVRNVLEPKIDEILTDIFLDFYYPSKGWKQEYARLMIDIHIENILQNQSD